MRILPVGSQTCDNIGWMVGLLVVVDCKQSNSYLGALLTLILHSLAGPGRAGPGKAKASPVEWLFVTIL